MVEMLYGGWKKKDFRMGWQHIFEDGVVKFWAAMSSQNI